MANGGDHGSRLQSSSAEAWVALGFPLALARVRAQVDVQRSHAAGDLLRFSSNWSVLVPGFDFDLRRDFVVGGRVGDFLDGGLDRWWSIQLGWLAADLPEVDEDSERCRENIASSLDRMIRWLDKIDDVATLIGTLERHDSVPFLQHDRRALHDVAVALGQSRL